jgi:hypothetical protein
MNINNNYINNNKNHKRSISDLPLNIQSRKSKRISVTPTKIILSEKDCNGNTNINTTKITKENIITNTNTNNRNISCRDSILQNFKKKENPYLNSNKNNNILTKRDTTPIKENFFSKSFYGKKNSTTNSTINININNNINNNFEILDLSGNNDINKTKISDNSISILKRSLSKNNFESNNNTKKKKNSFFVGGFCVDLANKKITHNSENLLEDISLLPISKKGNDNDIYNDNNDDSFTNSLNVFQNLRENLLEKNSQMQNPKLKSPINVKSYNDKIQSSSNPDFSNINNINELNNINLLNLLNETNVSNENTNSKTNYNNSFNINPNNKVDKEIKSTKKNFKNINNNQNCLSINKDNNDNKDNKDKGNNNNPNINKNFRSQYSIKNININNNYNIINKNSNIDINRKKNSIIVTKNSKEEKNDSIKDNKNNKLEKEKENENENEEAESSKLLIKKEYILKKNDKNTQNIQSKNNNNNKKRGSYNGIFSKESKIKIQETMSRSNIKKILDKSASPKVK